jgi:hypothetical protein
MRELAFTSNDSGKRSGKNEARLRGNLLCAPISLQISKYFKTLVLMIGCGHARKQQHLKDRLGC